MVLSRELGTSRGFFLIEEVFLDLDFIILIEYNVLTLRFLPFGLQHPERFPLLLVLEYFDPLPYAYLLPSAPLYQLIQVLLRSTPHQLSLSFSLYFLQLQHHFLLFFL